MSTSPQQPTYIIPPPQGPNWKTPLAIGAFLLLIISNVYLYFQLERVKTETKTEMAKLSSDVSATVEQIRIDSSASVRAATRNVQAVQQQLEEERRSAERAVGQAKVDAQKRVDMLQQRVAAEQAKQQQVIDQVKQTADTATTKLNDVSTDVGNVKTDLGSTKSQLEQTVANLRRVTGDVDSHASLIATNGKELAALRALGERNYFEFTVKKEKTPQKIGDIQIQLKKADQKRNKYTIEILVDDKRMEKKDRTINEPVQFYTAKAAHQASEIVVNEVRKDTIVGYLSTPKVQAAR